MAVESDHRRTLHHSQIVLELQKGDVNSLADQLYRKRMIFKGENVVIQDTPEKATTASRLINVVRRQAQSSSSYYDDFIAILRTEQFASAYSGLADMLEDNSAVSGPRNTCPVSQQTFQREDCVGRRGHTRHRLETEKEECE